jgi:biotin transport system substrate-specific component
MSSLSIAYGRPTLADRVFSRNIVTDIVLVAAGTALTSILAQIAIPLWPVPITGQTFAVLLVGAALGATRAALSMVLYLVIGILGLPVFANHASGSLFALPAGGFIVGFIFAAALVGWLSQREWDRKWLRTLIAFVLGTVVMYAFGLPWLFGEIHNYPAAALMKYFGTSNPYLATLQGGLYPFLIGDGVKAILAAIILPLVWRLAATRKHTTSNPTG